MDGQSNHKIVDYFALEKIQDLQLEKNQVEILAVGFKVRALIAEMDFVIDKYLAIPGSINGITALDQEMLIQIEEWRKKKI